VETCVVNLLDEPIRFYHVGASGCKTLDQCDSSVLDVPAGAAALLRLSISTEYVKPMICASCNGDRMDLGYVYQEVSLLVNDKVAVIGAYFNDLAYSRFRAEVVKLLDQRSSITLINSKDAYFFVKTKSTVFEIFVDYAAFFGHCPRVYNHAVRKMEPFYEVVKRYRDNVVGNDSGKNRLLTALNRTCNVQ
jgi:hypothetical protein